MSTNESDNRQLVEFLGREFGRAKERMCTGVSLSQAPAGARGSEIRAWHRDESPELFDSLGNVENLAQQMLDMAQREATSRGPGRHRFVVRTTQHIGGGASHAFYLIVDPEEDFTGLDGGTDPKDQIAQQMRHTEWAIKAMLGLAQSNTASYQQQIRTLANQNEQLYQDRARMIAQLEASQIEEAERTMAMLSLEKADERKDAILKQLLPLAPIALARFVSKGAPAGSGASALGPVLKNLIKSFKEPQLAKLGSILNVEQQLLFMEAIRIVQDMDAAEAKNAAQSPDGSDAGAQAST